MSYERIGEVKDAESQIVIIQVLFEQADWQMFDIFAFIFFLCTYVSDSYD